jgi:hypothetical protein
LANLAEINGAGQALAWLTALFRMSALVMSLLQALDAHSASLAMAHQVLTVLGPRLAHWLEQANAEWWRGDMALGVECRAWLLKHDAS